MDVNTIAELVEDTLFSTQPAMIVNLKACVSSPAVRDSRHKPCQLVDVLFNLPDFSDIVLKTKDLSQSVLEMVFYIL